MLDLIIDGKEISIPTRWEDLTWRQGKNIPTNSGEGFREWVKYFTGIENPRMELSKFNYDMIAAQVLFVQHDPKISTEDFSGAFEIEGKEYQMVLPADIHTYRTGPYEDLMHTYRQYAEKDDSLYEGTEIMGKLLVEYAIRGKKYNYNKALKRNIDNMNFIRVNQMVAFFLKEQLSSKNGTRDNSRKAPTRIKRLLQGIKKLARSTG